MPLAKEHKDTIIAEHLTHEGDTGSPEVQVALLTEQINKLTGHMKDHKNDSSSQRSLIIMVSRRQRHLGFLKRTKPESYRQIIKKLGLRK